MSVKVIAIVALAVAGALLVAHQLHKTEKVNTGFSHEYLHSEKALLAAGQKPVNYEMLFNHYKQIHNLKFGASEDSTRFNIFKANCDIIVDHNAKNSSYELGLTPLAHLTREEFAATRLGYTAANNTADSNTTTTTTVNATNVANAGELDWSTKGAVTPIKDQGACGSCWTFSTTGALEGLNQIKNGQLLSFSEQELVDCAGSYGNNGCNGGLMDNAFKYVADKGISLEKDYAYTGTDGTCKKVARSSLKISSYKDVDESPEALVQALNNGPVSVAIEADTSAFQLYKGGVLTGDACGTQLDHGVLAVGYGTQDGKDFFKVKNSWGAGWGQQGFILIGRAPGAGVCGINSAASYPTL